MKPHSRMAVRARFSHARGFSLLEVLISLVIVAVGLLGVAKMQAAALANTQIARTRSLIALQADSLAGAMHANYAYWSTLNNALSLQVTANGAQLGGVTDCTANVCTPQQMAAYDVQSWAATMNAHFPTYNAAINCTAADLTATPIAPSVCTVTITWAEKYIAINQTTATGDNQQVAAASATDPVRNAPQFTFFVEP